MLKMDNFLILTTLISEISFLHSYKDGNQRGDNVQWELNFGCGITSTTGSPPPP